MSVFAMFSLKYESLLAFDQQSESSLSNLKSLFGIKQVGSDSCLRKVLNKLDWKFAVAFGRTFSYLKKLGIVISNFLTPTDLGGWFIENKKT